MTIRVTQWALDVTDVGRMADFWAAALGYTAAVDDDGDMVLQPPAATTDAPRLYLQPGAPPKLDKNRSHFDVVTDGDIDSEISRLESLGATRADVGQRGVEAFTVLRDPEGNEFCLLHRRAS